MAVIVDPPENKEATLAETFSFFSLDQSNVLVSAIKKCDDSNDVILRLVEVEGREASMTINAFRPIHNLQPTDMIEDVVKKSNTQKSTIGAFAIETFKLQMN